MLLLFTGAGVNQRGLWSTDTGRGATTARQSIHEMLELARARLRRLSPAEAHAAARDGGVLVDARGAEQIAADGRVPGAVVISLNVLEWRLDPDSDARLAHAPALDEPVIVMCNEGFSSSLAAARLQDLGFAHATDVIGGFQAWRAAGLPVELSATPPEPRPAPLPAAG